MRTMIFAFVALLGLLAQVDAFAPAGISPVLRRGGLKATSPLAPRMVVDDKTEVREYFNNEGFNRWNKIYSESDEVNVVQKFIRSGHQETVDKCLRWVDEDGSAARGDSFCDAGCGVGTLAIPLAQRGANVRASDISESMAMEGKQRAGSMELKGAVTFETADLETLQGKYDTTTCIDVLIHYPREKMDDMVGHLCSISDKRFIISFAPYTPLLAALKFVGSLAPGPSKATRAYLHAEADVVAALNKRGFTVKRNDLTSTNFYYSRIIEAVKSE